MFSYDSAKMMCVSTEVSILCFIPSYPVTSCPFGFDCCCIPVLLSFTSISDIPGNLSCVFAVWKKCSEENETKTELDPASIQPRILSLTAEREACRSMLNTWARFSSSLQTICSLGMISPSCPALLSSFSLSHAGFWLLSHATTCVYPMKNRLPSLALSLSYISFGVSSAKLCLAWEGTNGETSLRYIFI